MKQYQDLFFDFDDTLCDTHHNAEEALKEVFGYFHFENYYAQYQSFHDTYWKNNIYLWERYARQEITFRELTIERFKVPLQEAFQDRGPDDEFCMEINSKFLELCAQKTGVVDGAHELIDYLKSKNYRLHLCSNGPHDIQYRKLESTGFINDFETINLSEDIGANKPSILFFRYALEKTGALPEYTLMIGDNYDTDIEGGMKAGLDTLLFDPQNQYENLSVKPTFTVNSLKEITKIL